MLKDPAVSPGYLLMPVTIGVGKALETGLKGSSTHLFRGLNSASAQPHPQDAGFCWVELAGMLLHFYLGLGALGPGWAWTLFFLPDKRNLCPEECPG